MPHSRRFAVILVAVLVLSPTSVSAAHTFGYLVNAERIELGLPVIPVDARLCSIAAWRSRDMLTRNYFSHDIPGQSGLVFAVMRRAGIKFTGTSEIIGWTTYPGAIADTWLIAAFMRSPPHRASIVGRWTGMCAGEARDATRTFVAVLFIRGD